MNPILDLFRNSLFSTTSLTNEINDRDELPDQVSSLVPFTEKSIITTTAVVMRKAHSLSLIPFSPRGAAGKEYHQDKRQGVQFEGAQLRQEFTVHADEVQNVLLFGSAGARLEALKDVVDEKMANVLDDERATMEYHRLGAVMGQIRDANGLTVVTDMFAKFGVEAWPVVNFDLANANPKAGALRTTCNEVIRCMRVGAQAKINTLHAFCGKAFMDALYAHPDVRTGYQWARENERLRDRAAYIPLDFGGIQFEEYTGYADGVTFVGDDDAHFFPMVVSGANPGNAASPVNRLFQVAWTPAPFLSKINTGGIPHYVRRFVDPSDDPAWIKYEISSYPIFMCLKPRALVHGKRTA